MTDHNDLIARLRREDKNRSSADQWWMDEAADALERVCRERDEMEKSVAEHKHWRVAACKYADRAEARAERLEAALRRVLDEDWNCTHSNPSECDCPDTEARRALAGGEADA